MAAPNQNVQPIAYEDAGGFLVHVSDANPFPVKVQIDSVTTSENLTQVAGSATGLAGAGVVGAGTQRMTLASDDPAVAALGAITGAKVVTDANGTIQQYLRGLVTFFANALGAGTAAASHRVTLASDDGPVGGVTETAPASDTASSGLNGRLQRIAQRLTSLIALFKTSTPATAATTSVASGTGVVTILAANPARIGASVFNDDANVLYLLRGGGTVSATVYSVQIPSLGYYEVPFGFTGILTGLWAADGSGSARVTEDTA